jgi:thiamine-phosphate pyrophosphorylase
MSQLIRRGLYAVTPDERYTPRLVVKVAAAVAGGAVLVQYRNKTATTDLRREQILALLPICHAGGADLIVNDDVALAIELEADGAHVGRDDAPDSLAVVRRALGPSRILGASCYNDLALAQHAAANGADYLAFGSMFVSNTKPNAVKAELELITEARRRFGLPVAAIGGITLTNAPRVIGAGADLLAVITDLFDAPDVQLQAQNYAVQFSN